MPDVQLNMRISEEIAERFRAFCKEQGISQPQGMDSLLSMMELVQAKETFPTRQTEIENFEMHAKSLVSAFLNSLEINAGSEERVKKQFVASMESKDKIITELQNKVEELQTLLNESRTIQKDSEEKKLEAEQAYSAAVKAAQNLEKTIVDKNAIIEMITGKLQEAESKLGNYSTLEAENKNAKIEVEKLKEQLKESQFSEKNAVMEAQLTAKNSIMEAQLEFAKERETMERQHNEEIKKLYEKLAAYSTAPANSQKTVSKDKKN